MKENGFVPSRRGILEHIRDGRLTPLEFTAHYFILSQADTRTGKWVGSAKCIASALCITERMARRVLENLSRGDYIRRFPVPGKHVCYPILVHKFYPTNGEHKGEQLDAISSLSPMDLRYVPIESGELEGEQKGEQKGEHVTSQKRIENREVRNNTPTAGASAETILRDETREAAFEAFWEVWPRKEARLAALRAWMKLPMEQYGAIMAGLGKWKQSDQWQRGIIPHPATWLNGRRWEDEISEGGTNGSAKKLSGDALTAANLRAAGYVQ